MAEALIINEGMCDSDKFVTVGGAEWRLMDASRDLSYDGSSIFSAVFVVSSLDGRLGAESPQQMCDVAAVLLSSAFRVPKDSVVVDPAHMELDRQVAYEPDPDKPWLQRCRATGMIRVSLSGYTLRQD